MSRITDATYISSTIEVHVFFSEVPHMRSSLPLPSSDVERNNKYRATQRNIPWPRCSTKLLRKKEWNSDKFEVRSPVALKTFQPKIATSFVSRVRCKKADFCKWPLQRFNTCPTTEVASWKLSAQLYYNQQSFYNLKSCGLWTIKLRTTDVNYQALVANYQVPGMSYALGSRVVQMLNQLRTVKSLDLPFV